ncbi:Mu transposase C-terminal domain-containing protein [Clostridium saccharoperbutylacetonicum]|uniref:Mu transposase C-terminal domain-containing protein n=1 Tax=Clostridium saccharoperbutylacetonicum TaxID=36745 RepID=UPI0039EC225A
MLFTNDLIAVVNDNSYTAIDRILWIDENNILAYTIDINSKNALPSLKRVSDILDGLRCGEFIKLENDPYMKLVDESNLSEKDKSIREKAWAVISEIAIEKNEPDILSSLKRGKLVKHAIDKFEISKVMVYKYLRKYWQRGKTKNCLLPDYEKSGGKGKERNVGSKKLGRPRKVGIGINVDEATKKIFRSAISSFYLTSKRNSLVTAYNMMMKEFYAEDYRFEDGIRKPILIAKDQLPTLTQFKYWYEKEQNIKKEISLRKGAKKFELNHRAILGKSDTNIMGPGSLYQIDATIGDVYLVSRYNRKWIIGRPVIYAIIDVFSRMIAGIYVGLEGPSWAGAMMALSNATINKINFCKEYDIDIDEAEWPCHHLPETIIGDNGEMKSKNVNNMINSLQIKIQNAPSYRADWKGIIEQYFHTINGYVKPLVPGSIDIDFRQRGGQDYRLDAKLDLHQFTKIIIKCALYHNNQHFLKDYNRSEDMLSEDLERIPIKLWNWGIKNLSGRLRTFPEEIVKLNLMPSESALVTGKGIKFKNIYYSCERALKEMWFENARNKGTWKINISYDPRNMNYIYIRSDDGRSFEVGHILDDYERYLDKTIYEVQYLMEYESLNKNKSKEKEIQEKVDLLSDIESIVKDAEHMTNTVQNKTDSKASRLRDIRKNRRNEKMLNREKEAFVLEDTDVHEGKVIRPSKYKSNEELSEDTEIGLLEKLQKERMYGKRNK